MKVGLVAYIIDGEPIYHDAVSRSEPDTHSSLMFCRGGLSLTDLKREMKKAGSGEPYEVRLGNDRFDLQKEFMCAYTLAFHNYADNKAFVGWLESLPTHEAAFIQQRLKDGGRYFSREFSEFREFENIEAFVSQRFDIWHEETVKEFEKAVAKGKVHCPGCNI